MLKVCVNGDVRFVDGDRGLMELVQQQMGIDVRDEIEELLVRSNCGGECDVTYRQQEHFERVIRDVLNDLRAAQKPGRLGQVDPIAYARALKALEGEL